MNVDKPDLPRNAAVGQQSTHLWIARPDGSLDYVNGAWRRFAGRSAPDMLGDGWTAVTKDKSLSAQFEHSIGVTKDGCEIFTLSPAGYTKPPYIAG